jgi:hypothetical protein
LESAAALLSPNIFTKATKEGGLLLLVIAAIVILF